MSTTAAVHPSEALECVRQLMEWSDGEGCLDPEAPLRDYMDSFMTIQLVAILEDRFQIRFEQGDLMDEDAWRTAREIAALVTQIRSRPPE
jgi:acyl carrier protein